VTTNRFAIIQQETFLNSTTTSKKLLQIVVSTTLYECI